MNILLSAYSCKPKSGSESGIGWAWATALAKRGHSVWVITNQSNQVQIERELLDNPVEKLNFFYCRYRGLPLQLKKFSWKIPYRIISVFLRYIIYTWWQWEAYRMIKSKIPELNLDCVHHVTISSIHFPSFMGFLGVPFYLGPLSGGVNTPKALRKSFGPHDRILEFLRDILNGSIKYNPFMNLVIANADRVFCDFQQTKVLIPARYADKCKILFHVYLDEMIFFDKNIQRPIGYKSGFRILYVGKFNHWKGIHLGLRAFVKFNQLVPSSSFTIVGRGPERERLKKLSKNLNIEKMVRFVPWMERTALSEAYLNHDVLMFPSLHDSIGMVVMEALSHGLPVICLDLGGPGKMVNESCGRVIKTGRLDQNGVIEFMKDALFEIWSDDKLYRRLSIGAMTRPKKFLFENVIERVYSRRN